MNSLWQQGPGVQLPLITITYLAYGAGLLTGFGGFAWIAVVASVPLAVFARSRGKHTWMACAAIYAAAAVIAVTTPPAERPTARGGPADAGGDALSSIREHGARLIDHTFGDDAPLARALLIADQHEIPTEMRDRYASAGLIHMLSISGLHVAVIAAAMELLFQVARLSRRTSLLGAFVTTAVYVAVIGAPPPALRSAAMLGVAMVSRIAQRPTSPWAAWAVGAFVPLVQPRIAIDVGYQLSVLGMAALVAAGALWKRQLATRVDGWKGKVARELITSLVACAVTAPLVAWVFGRISLVAPLSNLVAAPVITLAQPILFLALVTGPLVPVARMFAEAVHPLLFTFDWIATASAAIPGAAVTVSVTGVVAALGAVAATSLVAACVSRFPVRPMLIGFGAMAAMVVAPLVPVGNANLVELHVLDVGQGDAILLRTPAGHWVLFDAGPTWRGGDAGRSTILPYILRRGGSLEAFVLSHPHADHVGGAASVLDKLRPRAYWDAAFAGGSESYIASLAEAKARGINWHRVHPGDSIALDGVTVSFLAPDSTWTVGLKDPNLASTIALIRYGTVRFLLVGDAEKPEEDWLLGNKRDELAADVLKVGHHGSSTSSSEAFLGAVHPELAIVSVGARNTYGHPSSDVLRALARAGAEVLRTDEAGTILVRTDGVHLEVEAKGNRWELSRDSVRR
ncbi:MAG TPA: DNA internalization-related competence protein ComEC/Rec2 [Gemmatimonadaceae bacterium]|nr:DNA internalization-related competence protein ComEC/Rec2 [Gemmatimonadaceae bacterium]